MQGLFHELADRERTRIFVAKIGPFLLRVVLPYMERDRKRLEIEAKLARCRELQREVNSDFTTAHLREVAAELQAELYRLIRKAHGHL